MVEGDGCAPSFAPRIPVNTFDARAVGSRDDLAHQLLRGIYFTEVGPSEIASVRVFVGDLARWPFTGHPEPGEARRSVEVAVNSDDPHAFAVVATGNVASANASAALNAPAKNSGLGVVVKDFTEPLEGELVGPRFRIARENMAALWQRKRFCTNARHERHVSA